MRSWRKIWVGFLSLNLLAIACFWWQGSGAEVLSKNWNNVAIAVGRLFGLLAAFAFLVQFFVMSRLPWLERFFGFDKLTNFHHLNGKVALPLLLLHPLFILLGYAGLTKTNMGEQMELLLKTQSTVVLAMIALVLFVTVAVTSIYMAWRQFRYESWYFVHLLAYLAIFFSFFHQIKLGSDLLINKAFYFYWIALYAVTLLAILVFRIIRPWWLWQKHQFVVSRLEQETHDVTSVYITGKNLQDFKIKPGQFMFFNFSQKGFWWQSHPFSLSIFPEGKELRISVKALGDFTEQIPKLKVGTRVLIDGPYGIFTKDVSEKEKSLFLAGGIGITPARSLIEELLREGKDVKLLYGCKTEADFALKAELEELESKYDLEVTYITSEEERRPFEAGYIDEEKLRRIVPDIKEREVFLCGPAPMTTAVLSLLEKFDVNKKDIHFEKFSLH